MDAITSFQGEYRWLSNFWEAPMMIRGLAYRTNEHYYQAMKCTRFEDHETIRLAGTPGEAKRLGRNFSMRPDWDGVKESIMLDGLWYKFSQHDELREMLLATGDAELIEGNPWGDTFWGVCNGVGENRLGILLMKLRECF